MHLDIINAGSGNVASVKNWIETSGFAAREISNPDALSSDILVLPGVGSTDHLINSLKEKRFDSAIQEHIKSGRKLIGICAGFQVLADRCKEGTPCNGLGIIHGTVEKISTIHSHNRWQSFHFNKGEIPDRQHVTKNTMYRKRVIKGRVFYNHEYGFVIDDKSTFSKPINESLSIYSAMAIKGNVFGMQFHPEKSQLTGSSILNMIL